MILGPSSQQLSDFVGDAVIATDLTHRVTYWNPAAEKLFGWRAAEAVGRVAFDLLQVSFLDSSLNEVLRLLAASGRWEGDVRHASKDGRTLLCETTVAGLARDEGRVDGYVVLLRDVTGRRQIERRLEGALAFNAKLLAAAPVGCLTYRLSGECVSCNETAATMAGATVDQLKQQNFRALESWKTSGLLNLAERTITTRRPQTADLHVVTTFGKDVWLLARMTVFRAEDEDLLLVIVGDITDRKRAESELWTLSRVLEQSPSSVIITDTAGTIEYANLSCLAASGYSLDEVVGQTPRIFKSGETSPEEYKQLWDTITSGNTWRGEFHNRRKNGELYWERATISAVVNDRGEIARFVAVKEDISAQKAAEEALRDAETRFQRAQKMEAIGQLTGGIAHDFNNLLTAILGYTDLVLDQIRGDSPLRGDVEEIKKAGERAALLTRQLLAFSRRQRLEPKIVDLNQVVPNLAKMASRLIGEDIHLDVVTADSLGHAKLDPGQIEQVILNLIVNSRDAMPTGGRLTIATANVDIDDRFAQRYEGAAPGPYVSLRVTDTGSGMSPEVLAHAFEPFFTTKPPGKGTGLGLATVYGIVRQSDGCVAIESQLGTGTTVACYFPRVDAPLSSGHTVASMALPARGIETVLLVEDDAGVRELSRRALRERGYSVLSAANGFDALEVEAHHAGPIHLLLTDVVMPGLGGPDLAQRLVRRRPTMKVLYVSGFARHLAIASGSLSQQVAFLPKPFTPEVLARKVRDVLDRDPDIEEHAFMVR